MIESHMVRRPSSRKHNTPKLPPHHTLPLSHEEGVFVRLVVANVLNAEQAEPEIFFTNQLNTKLFITNEGVTLGVSA
jgi:hypothetical protein